MPTMDGSAQDNYSEGTILPLQIGRCFNAYSEINKAIEKHRELFGVRLALKRAVKLENYPLKNEPLKNLKLKYGELDYHCFLDTGRPGRPGNGGRCSQLVRLKLSSDTQTLVVYDSHNHSSAPSSEKEIPSTPKPLSMAPSGFPTEASFNLKGDITVTSIGQSRGTPISILPKAGTISILPKPLPSHSINFKKAYNPVSPYGTIPSKNISTLSSLTSTTITPLMNSSQQSQLSTPDGGQEKIKLKLKKSPHMPNEMVVVGANSMSSKGTPESDRGSTEPSLKKRKGDVQRSPSVSYEPLNSLAIVSTPEGSLSKLDTFSESSSFHMPPTPIPKKKYDKESPGSADKLSNLKSSLDRKPSRSISPSDSQSSSEQPGFSHSHKVGLQIPKPPPSSVQSIISDTNSKHLVSSKSVEITEAKIVNEKSSLTAKSPDLSMLCNLPNSTTVIKSEYKTVNFSKSLELKNAEIIDLTNSPTKPRIPAMASSSVTITKTSTKNTMPSSLTPPTNKSHENLKVSNSSSGSSNSPVITLDSDDNQVVKTKIPPAQPESRETQNQMHASKKVAHDQFTPSRSSTSHSSVKPLTTPPLKSPAVTIAPKIQQPIAPKPSPLKKPTPKVHTSPPNSSSQPRIHNPAMKPNYNLKITQDKQQPTLLNRQAQPTLSQKQVSNAKGPVVNKALPQPMKSTQPRPTNPPPPPPHARVSSVAPKNNVVADTATGTSAPQTKLPEKADRNGGTSNSQKNNDRVLQPKLYNHSNGISQSNPRLLNVKRLKKKPGRYPDNINLNNSSSKGGLDTELGFGEKQHLAHNVLLQLLRVTSQLPMVEFSHALEILELLTDAFNLRQRVSLSISRDQEDICPSYLDGYPDVHYPSDDKETKVTSTTDDVQLLESQIDGEVDIDSFLRKLKTMKVEYQGTSDGATTSAQDGQGVFNSAAIHPDEQPNQHLNATTQVVSNSAAGVSKRPTSQKSELSHAKKLKI